MYVAYSSVDVQISLHVSKPKIDYNVHKRSWLQLTL